MMDSSDPNESSRPRILIVDDEPRSLDLMARALRGVGTVDTAASAEVAMEKLQSGIYHLVITDHRMPGTKGAELLAWVAEHDERIGRVMITGYADMKATVDAINRGRLNAYISKPWKPDQLALIAKSLIERSAAARTNQVLLEQLSKRNEELEIATAELRRLRRGLGTDVSSGGMDLPIAPLLMHLESQLPKAADASGERVQLMIDRMRETCETLMELSGETGELELLRHEGVDDVLRGVLVAVAPEVEEADVTLIGGFSCASSPPLDGPRLARAFEQVILNALEASTRGGRVWVDSHCARGETIVRVTDEGTGWPDPIRDQVFDPFVSYAKPGHCGVGLTAAKKIIEAHGGEIEALDADGTGAVVQIRIPIP